MKAVLALLALFGLAACSDMCANTEHQTVRSPDGDNAAIVFDRDCGATTGFNTQVSVVVVDQKAADKGNVFIADGGARTASWGGPWAKASWVGHNQLLVRYDDTARIFTQNESVGDSQISFEPVAR
ncbi:MAG: hypothetical protein Q8R44_07570 [Novosphingobium sp.]|nr:hypothetical protein [Novosphingobium sp.]